MAAGCRALHAPTATRSLHAFRRPPPVTLFLLSRSTAAVLNNAPLVAGAALCMGATRLLTLLAGRFLAGVGAGAASVLVPRYVSEIAPTAIRGALGTGNQASAGMGCCRALGASSLAAALRCGGPFTLLPVQPLPNRLPPLPAPLHTPQVCINVGIVSAYALGYPYEAGIDTVTVLGHTVAWWCAPRACCCCCSLLLAAGVGVPCAERLPPSCC